MSVYCIAHLEAKLDGEWKSIDHFQKSKSGEMKRVPLLWGQSIVYSMASSSARSKWYRVSRDFIGKELQEDYPFVADLFSETRDYRGYYILDGKDLEKYRLDRPDICGFFLKEDIYRREEDYEELDADSCLTVEEYEELSPEAKKAYVYYEYTEPYGETSIMKDLKNAVSYCVSTFNDECRYDEDYKNSWPEITFNDIRLVMIVEW